MSEAPDAAEFGEELAKDIARKGTRFFADWLKSNGDGWALPAEIITLGVEALVNFIVAEIKKPPHTKIEADTAAVTIRD